MVRDIAPMIKQTMLHRSGHSKSQRVSTLDPCIGSKVAAILLDGKILPIGGIASWSVCDQRGYPVQFISQQCQLQLQLQLLRYLGEPGKSPTQVLTQCPSNFLILFLLFAGKYPPMNWHKLNKVFNRTMTFRRDSDVVVRYWHTHINSTLEGTSCYAAQLLAPEDVDFQMHHSFVSILQIQDSD